MVFAPSQPGKSQRKTLTSGDPVFGEQINFLNRLLIGDWMLRTESGTTSCLFRTTDAGYCTFGRPGYLVVEQSGVPTIYDISKGAGAELEIRDGRHACRMGRRIRTHGDTIVPNL
jgi:hypothetical protein